jgi:hypothetical protein
MGRLPLLSAASRLLSRRWAKRLARNLLVGTVLGVLAMGFIVLFSGDTPGGNSLQDKALAPIRDILFDYVAWELGAIGYKLNQVQGGVSPYLDEATRSAVVVDYLRLVAEFQTTERRIASLYSDPTVRDPEANSRALRERRDQQRRDLDQRQPLAEAIIETQVAAVLREEGFSTLGEIIPPVSAHFTRPPQLVVVSPRGRIEFAFATNILNLSASEMAEREAEIEQITGASALVVPIGGIGLYPTMVMEHWQAFDLFDTVAHEWSHNYLMFFPLGLGYLSNPETRIINETAATLFGEEISRKVIERYYRDFPTIMAQLPPPPPPADARPTPTPRPRDPAQPPAFDATAELHYIRTTVDYYLEHGLVELAERFMENRRRVFIENGYSIRRINQAFFAFYGGYQGPGGSSAGGSDPIGPAVSELRAASPSIKAWIEALRSVTTREDLLRLRDQTADQRP